MNNFKSHAMLLLMLTAYSNGYAAEEQKIIEGKKVTLQSKEGRIFKVSQELFSRYSETLRNMFGDATSEDLPIPLELVTSDALETIIKCLTQPEMIETILLSLSGDQLLNVAQAINFLDIQELLTRLPQIKWLSRLMPLSEVLLEHTDPLRAMAISSDGNLVITGTNTKIKIWNAKSGRCIKDWEWNNDEEQMPLLAIQISPDCKFIVTLSQLGAVKTWDIETGKCLQTLDSNTTTQTSLAISPDSSFVMTKHGQGKIALWDPRSGECLHVLTIYPEAAHGDLNAYVREVTLSTQISSNGQLILVRAIGIPATIWEVKSGLCIKTLQYSAEPEYLKTGISPDSKFIVRGDSYPVRIFDLTSGTCLKILGQDLNQDKVLSIAISQDSKFIVIGSYDGTVRVWDAESGTCLQTLGGHTNTIDKVAINYDNSVIIACSCVGIIKIWDIKSGECLKTLQADFDFHSLAISSNGNSIVTKTKSFDDKTARIWSLSLPDLIWPQLELLTKIYVQAQKSEKLTIKSQSLDENTLKSLAAPVSEALQQYVRISNK